ncbi:hypothetical protein BRADI_2g24975v3 [Brachypodium distachyon]|uniref:Endonuclease/exonuclease/phosphatase domain-containing protein n=1 Tax=Brachypodium distachyon TaxID=15368 RepID=A0A2K2DAB6_BRADI|nr:hypothetical protein BRADI_2g24975v3 [Brachypodium distachyon]
MEKAAGRKKWKIEGLSLGKASANVGLPAEELLEIAGEGCPPLPRKDLLQLASACGIDPSALTTAAPPWNVRGLGRPAKCTDIKAALAAASPSIICLQETKLTDISIFKAYSFLPPACRSFLFVPSDGASGGILTAWNDSDWDCILLARSSSFISYSFSSTFSSLSFCVTNVYGPCEHSEKQGFLDGLAALEPSVPGPWAILGDFNLTMRPSDRSNANFNHAEVASFAGWSNSLHLQEIPLLGRAFTWSSQQTAPTLVRLDRAFVNIDWSGLFPNSTLSFLPHSTTTFSSVVLFANLFIMFGTTLGPAISPAASPASSIVA